MVRKLEEQNFYLNSLKRKIESKSGLDASPNKKQKKILSAKAGCSNWNPKLQLDKTDTTNYKSLLSKLQPNDETFTKVFLETYAEQRKFLNQDHDMLIDSIRNEWPTLLTDIGIKLHYKELLGHSIDELEIALFQKAETIIAFANKKKIKVNVDKTSERDQKAKEVIRIISILLKEDISDFLFELPNYDMIDQIVTTARPCLILKNNQNNRIEYFVAIEKQIITTGTETFIEALKQCYTFYYILNLQYIRKFSSTLEFIQRYFLKTHPRIVVQSLLLTQPQKGK
ncbi:hypothetical protein FQR65_LT13656 [Abscondita terminalis]|nr:hypothetical protein FQR65_LT13656 [Abscondita terminalis]